MNDRELDGIDFIYHFIRTDKKVRKEEYEDWLNEQLMREQYEAEKAYLTGQYEEDDDPERLACANHRHY